MNNRKYPVQSSWLTSWNVRKNQQKYHHHDAKIIKPSIFQIYRRQVFCQTPQIIMKSRERAEREREQRRMRENQILHDWFKVNGFCVPLAVSWCQFTLFFRKQCISKFELNFMLFSIDSSVYFPCRLHRLNWIIFQLKSEIKFYIRE